MKTSGERYLGPELTGTFREEQKMVLLGGPRQVGKTILSRYLLSGAGSPGMYFNREVEEDSILLNRHPGNFWTRREAPSGPRRPMLVPDEIHKFPRWKRFVKGLHDGHGTELRILVTGSGRLDVFQLGGDSLFGRYNLFRRQPRPNRR